MSADPHSADPHDRPAAGERRGGDDDVEVEADVVLSDGSTVHIRPIRPDDGERLVRFHAGLSPDTQYLRFFSPHPVLSPREVERFTHVDYWDRFAIVAQRNDDFVGVARYDRQPGSGEAEVAFVIADSQQGKGLGMLMLEHLAAAARRRAVTRFVAETLPSNTRMLQVFRQAGFTATTRFGDGVVHVEFPISPTEESRARQDRREHRAEARSVARLLSPRSVAVVGASREAGTVGWMAFRSLLDGGFEGPVYPVNPSAAFVSSVRSYPTVVDVPDPVDLAVLAVPAAAVLGVVEDCARKGVNALVVLSAGFGEANLAGDLRQRDVVSAARRGGMRLVGPNCIGVVNTDPGVSLHATFATPAPAPGPVGILSQSGALGVALLHLAAERGLGVSSFVSVGNKADVSGNDLLQYWEDDPRTSVILLYLESFGNPRKFSRLARRVGRSKPIVVVKSGRSAAGLRAVAPPASPPGSASRAAPAGPATAAAADEAVEALFRQTGVIRVETPRQMVEVAQLLASQPLPAGKRIAIVSNSGGPGVMTADVGESVGLLVPELAARTQSRLRELLHPDSVVANPVDLVAASGGAEYEGALRTVLGDDAVDAVIAVFTPTASATADEVATAVAAASAAVPAKPVLACFLATPTIPAALRSAPGDTGRWIPFYPAPESAVLALARVVGYAEWRRAPEGVVPEPAGLDPALARRIAGATLAGSPEGRWLEPAEAAELLSAYGIDVVATRCAASAEEAVDAAQAIGYPVALKAANASLPHRSDLGAVHLGLADADAVLRAFAETASRLGAGMGGAAVQPMAGSGVETIAGIVQNPSFGSLVMFGMGGLAAELLGDRAYRAVPLTDIDAAGLVRSLGSSPLLFGYRGSPPADVGAVEDLLVRLGRLADDLPEVAELHLDPVIVATRGLSVVDAKIRIAPPPAPGPDTRRLREITDR